MANPTCSVAGFQTSCYRMPTINALQQRALKIYAMILQLQAIGGTDYRGSNLVGTLVTDATQLTCGMRQPDMDAALIHILFTQAAGAGATVPADINAKSAAINCLLNVNPDLMSRMELLLTCKLGVRKAYPQ